MGIQIADVESLAGVLTESPKATSLLRADIELEFTNGGKKTLRVMEGDVVKNLTFTDGDETYTVSGVVEVINTITNTVKNISNCVHNSTSMFAKRNTIDSLQIDCSTENNSVIVVVPIKNILDFDVVDTEDYIEPIKGATEVYPFTSVDEYLSATMGDEFDGKDVYLSVSCETIDSPMRLIDEKENPPILHLIVNECNFEMGNGSAGEFIAVSNIKSAIISDCKFGYNDCCDYGVLIDVANVTGSEIIIKNSEFAGCGNESAIKVSSNTEEAIKKVTITGCTFTNNTSELTVGTYKDENPESFNTKTGAFGMLISKNTTAMKIKEPYLVCKGDTVPVTTLTKLKTANKTPNGSFAIQ